MEIVGQHIPMGIDDWQSTLCVNCQSRGVCVCVDGINIQQGELTINMLNVDPDDNQHKVLTVDHQSSQCQSSMCPWINN